MLYNEAAVAQDRQTFRLSFGYFQLDRHLCIAIEVDYQVVQGSMQRMSHFGLRGF